jgi:diaminopimelate decarboxylase
MGLIFFAFIFNRCNFPGGIWMENTGNLVFGGWDVLELASRFGTPLYVLSEDMVRNRCGILRSSFLEKYEKTQAVYASKAFLTLAMCRILQEEGIGLDVVSGGELSMALKAGFPMERVMFHGNNKLPGEIELALKSGVGRIVVDSESEFDLLEAIAAEMGLRASVLFRVAPGVDAHTHKYIATGHTASKFGMPVMGDGISALAERAMGSDHIDLKGFHYHVGSQLMENVSHLMAADVMLDLMKKLKDSLGFETEELNIGGGFGVPQLPGEKGVQVSDFTGPVMERICSGCKEKGLEIPTVIIEPGRWIVSEAGITLYSVGAVKEIPGVMTYVSVDGGMTDNPRPALYGASYHGVIANRMGEKATETVTVVGKCCESGDVIIRDLKVPPVRRGDILAVYNTGAYNFSMASNYNMNLRPAVVLVSEGRADLIVRRQSYEDLLMYDVVPEHLHKA